MSILALMKTSPSETSPRFVKVSKGVGEGTDILSSGVPPRILLTTIRRSTGGRM